MALAWGFLLNQCRYLSGFMRICEFHILSDFRHSLQFVEAVYKQAVLPAQLNAVTSLLIHMQNFSIVLLAVCSRIHIDCWLTVYQMQVAYSLS